MYAKQEIIIKSHLEGQSQREIARNLGISHKTVKKHLQEHDEILQSADCIETAHSENLSSAQIYKMTAPRRRLKLTREVEGIIDGLLLKNEEKKQTGLGKQMLKKKDILEELHRQGYDIGYTTACNYIALKEKRQKPKKAFIRQVYHPGEICEFDWGEIKLVVAGKRKSLQLAVFTSAFSNYRHAFIYERQDTLDFIESHVHFFAATGGVYREMAYNNICVAVVRFVSRNEKESTRALLQLRGITGSATGFAT